MTQIPTLPPKWPRSGVKFHLHQFFCVHSTKDFEIVRICAYYAKDFMILEFQPFYSNFPMYHRNDELLTVRIILIYLFNGKQ